MTIFFDPEVNVLGQVKINEQAKVAILVIDMINDFAHTNGALFVKDSIPTIEPIVKLVRKAKSWSIPVFYCNDRHSEDDPEFLDWPPHAVQNTWGAELISELTAEEYGTEIYKEKFDPFFGTLLKNKLSFHCTDTLILTGTVSNICVLAAANTAAMLGYKIIVPLDCWSALEKFGYLAAAYQLDRVYKAKLVESVDNITYNPKA